MMRDFYISDDKALLNIELIHSFLSDSYWAKHIPLATVNLAIENSNCFGVYTSTHQQVGFARLITDKATFAYLADVFILPEHRNKGLSKKLMLFIQQHPDTQNLRRIVLATSDAHSLYSQFEFTPLSHPESFMEIWQPNIYRSANEQ